MWSYLARSFENMNNPLLNFFRAPKREHRGARVCFWAAMNLLTVTCLTGALLMTGCETAPQVPGTAKQNYPAVIKDSNDQRAKAEREWRRMLDAYGVPQTPPDLYP